MLFFNYDFLTVHLSGEKCFTGNITETFETENCHCTEAGLSGHFFNIKVLLSNILEFFLKHTKLAMLPTLYSHTFAISSFI